MSVQARGDVHVHTLLVINSRPCCVCVCGGECSVKFFQAKKFRRMNFRCVRKLLYKIVCLFQGGPVASVAARCVCLESRERED